MKNVSILYGSNMYKIEPFSSVLFLIIHYMRKIIFGFFFSSGLILYSYNLI